MTMLDACKSNWERIRSTFNAMQAELRELKAGAVERDRKIAQQKSELAELRREFVVYRAQNQGR